MQRFAKGDRTAAREISKQAQKAHDEEHALRRAVQGKEARDSDSEAVELSEDDALGTVKKAQRLTVKEIRCLGEERCLRGGGARNLEADGELPSTGLLGMKFMQQAQRKEPVGTVSHYQRVCM